MGTTRIADVFQIRSRFMRSIHLERDFSDESVVQGYVLTPHARAGMERLAEGLLPRSTQRSWRITGDYGTGKSSFALALARLFSGQTEGLPVPVRQAVDFRHFGGDRPHLLPVLVTDSRTHLGTAILHSLATAVESAADRGRKPQILDRIRSAAAAAVITPPADQDVLAFLEETVSYVRESGRGTGLLLILDELGKFLEYAAIHPEQQDIYFLQALAEAAARSGGQPLFVIGLLHQGFNAYAEQLSQVAQKEWEKVAGRFEEILFNQPLEQTAGLVADALNVRLPRLPRDLVTLSEREMAHAVDLGWFGAGASRQILVGYAPRLFPLHPTVLPVLVRLFSRFGQNERSLFSFLLSDEPCSLQAFAEAPLPGAGFYRIHHLYDYARSAFGHRLSVQSYRSHWNQIESVVESFPRDELSELDILKTVAVLNLLDAPGLMATEETIALTVAGAGTAAAGRVKQALKRLQRDRSILYFRGAAAGYCLWPHTSVNLERAYQDASRAIPLPQRVGPLIGENLETRPLVARRHYIETGNLRHFTVSYTPPSDMAQAVTRDDPADGRIVVALCETEEERFAALRGVSATPFRDRKDVLLAVPRPLQGLASLLQEVQRWEWIAHNVPELNHDAYAMEEVTRQLTAARAVLEKRVRSYVGLRQFAETMDLEWFHAGRPLSVRSGRELLSKLSAICDRLYPQAPKLKNELVNRHTLSSAAAAARMRLIERVFRFPSSPCLGMEPAAKPPEMSMYLSVFQAAGLHREHDGRWMFCVPSEGADPCNVRPVFERMLHLLEERRDGRVKVPDLFQSLRMPPYGIRDGLCPLLLAVFAALHEQDVAFYENGAFVRVVAGQELQRLSKAPETFEIQYCHIGGVRAVVFERLYHLLTPEGSQSAKPSVLDVVRPLCVFAAQLPAYTHKTGSLSSEAQAVREALLRAEEPATLIFRHLPVACGLDPFAHDQPPSSARVKQFVQRLRSALDELRATYPGLLERMQAVVTKAFDRPGDFDQVRESLANAADSVLVAVADARLKAFCLRLADRGLETQPWLESLGSFVCSKPPSK
jgi:hypothetical protein